jgi:hypothetical protein
MEKFGVKSSDLRDNLLAEEKLLKQKIAGMKSRSEKIASSEMPALNQQLLQIRTKISEIEAGMMT